MFECLQSKQGSGTLLWMSQSAWPSLICQLYDYYLEYTSSYFSVKNACAPIHAFYDPAKKEIRAANNTISNINNAKLIATIYNSSGEKIWSKSSESNIPVATTKTFFDIDYKPVNKVQYLKLELQQKGRILSNNFYWLENDKGNCIDLNELPKTAVNLEIHKIENNEFYIAKVILKNTSSVISLLNKIKLKDKNTGESILPVFFDDDYISLLPGEQRTINVKVEKKYLNNKNAEMVLEGWNTKTVKQDINIKIY